MKKVVLYIITLYSRHISPVLNAASLSIGVKSGCRFNPTCSSYTYQAIERYGIILGSFKALKRLARCNPFNKGGNDPLL